ncbi:rhamnosyltransferase [Ligilactobacillus sp. WC1T17]|uniref:Rhamnosyltransferase n=1 Tax=Ligilactobacillus ruminis TaxID=1623 RepID=A0ABY1A8W7_9LACO|nr:rhamnosyltransferase [Ligilactobacillus ruminis]
MKKVQVLLSTYNAEKYLRKQLDTVYAQEGVEVELLVRDDGSSDSTLEILNEYQKENALKILDGPNLGFAKSFWTLVQNAGGADYYAFCDQDDLWDRDKLSEAISSIEKKQPLMIIPMLYTSNAIAVNDNLEVIKENCFDFSGVLSYADCLQHSVLPGCTFVFNDALREIAKQYNGRIVAHDFIMYQLAETFGEVVYDEKAHIRYRIHSGNTIGINSPLKEFFDKVKRQFARKKWPKRSEIAKDILDTYGEKIPIEKREVLELFSQANRVKNWTKILSFSEYRNVDFILMMLLGRI